MIRWCHRRGLPALAAATALLAATVSGSAAILCMSVGGHLAIERLGEACCRAPAGTSAAPVITADERCAPDCLDFALPAYAAKGDTREKAAHPTAFVQTFALASTLGSSSLPALGSLHPTGRAVAALITSRPFLTTIRLC